MVRMDEMSVGMEEIARDKTDQFLDSLAAENGNDQGKFRPLYQTAYSELKTFLEGGGLIAGDGTFIPAHGDMSALNLPPSLPAEITQDGMMSMHSKQLPLDLKEKLGITRRNNVSVVIFQPGSLEHLKVDPRTGSAPSIHFGPQSWGIFDAFQKVFVNRLEKNIKKENLEPFITPHVTIRSMLVQLQKEYVPPVKTPQPVPETLAPEPQPQIERVQTEQNPLSPTAPEITKQTSWKEQLLKTIRSGIRKEAAKEIS